MGVTLFGMLPQKSLLLKSKQVQTAIKFTGKCFFETHIENSQNGLLILCLFCFVAKITFSNNQGQVSPPCN